MTFYEAAHLRLQLANYLREKQVLLVLDNFEHLLEGVDLLTDLLQAAPAVKFLVTSRERLNVQEKWVLALEGLSFPQDEANTPLESYSAVQLFRAARATGAGEFFAGREYSGGAENLPECGRNAAGTGIGGDLAAGDDLSADRGADGRQSEFSDDAAEECRRTARDQRDDGQSTSIICLTNSASKAARRRLRALRR